jgi:hypothetical protein
MGAYDETRLYEELERVTAVACSAAREDDGERLAVLVEQRQALVELIGRARIAVDARSVTRILDLDRELLARVTARRDRLRRDLEQLARVRGSLASYGVDLHHGAVYLERTG